MSHRSVTVLVSDGDLRSLQAALWHGKPAVVLPTSLDQVDAVEGLGNDREPIRGKMEVRREGSYVGDERAADARVHVGLTALSH